MTEQERRRRIIEKKKEAQRIKKRKKMDKVYLVILAFELILGALLIHGFHLLKNENKTQSAIPDELLTVNDGDKAAIYVEPISLIESADLMVSDEPIYATITTIGDVMMHKWQIERSYDSTTDSFDVSDSFTYIKKYLSESDYTIGNLETTLAGRNNGSSNDIYGYSGYPMFNAPEVLADALKDDGVDFLSTANNHSLDSWEDGVYATIDYLDSVGIEHTGTFKTEADSEELCIKEINGITFGFVSYTYATNGIPVPDDAPYCINTLENYEDEKLQEMYDKVRALDEAGVDFVCPIIHFGTEYQEMPDSWQEMVVDGLFEAGADVIFGGHPHVVEPMDVRTITNADGTTRTGYVMYSYGNFVSSQYYDGVNKDLGIISDFTFSKQIVDGQTVCKVEKIMIEPTYVYWTDETIGVIPVLEAYNNQSNYSFLSSNDWDRINFAKDHIIELLMTYGNLDYTIEGDKYSITVK